ncbi:tetratricopeptide repeat protein [Chloroflexota bacterium]
MKKVIAILIAVILLLSLMPLGCGPTAAPPEVPPEAPPGATSEPEIAVHYTTYTSEAGLFSISYPPDWETALSSIEDLEKATEEIVTSIEEDLPLERTRTLFFAGLPTETGYEPNVNIVVESLPGIISTHDQMVEAENQGIKDVVEDYHEFSQVKTTIGGREATIVDWEGTFPQIGGFRCLQALILVGKVAWIVTCVPPAGEVSKWESEFHAIVRTLRILTGTAEWHSNQAYELNNQGRYDEAIEECNKAIEFDPNLADAYVNRATAYGYKRQYDLAIDDCNKAIELDPNLAEAYVIRGWAYNEKGQYDLAMPDHNKAIELDPNLADAYLHRAWVYKQLGKKTEAIADFEKLINLTDNPEWIEWAQQQIEELQSQ